MYSFGHINLLNATTATRTYSTSLSDYKDCVPTSTGCKTGYTFHNEACHETTVACADSATLTLLNADVAEKTYKVSTGDYGDCVPTHQVVRRTYTFDDDACYETTVTCTDSALLTRLHATAAEKTYSTSLNDYGDCIPTSSGCETGYTFDNDACHESETACSSQELIALHATKGTKTYDSNANDYASCVMSACINGYVKDSGSCRAPSANKYADSSGVERNCNTTPVIDRILKLGGQAVPVSDDNSCPFTCVAGSIKNPQGNRTCDLCTGLPDHANWATPTQPVSSAISCPWECEAGSKKDLNNPVCNLPSKGNYFDTQGSEQSCTGLPAHASGWADPTGPVASATGCPFTCISGYYSSINRNVCVKNSIAVASGEGFVCTILYDGSATPHGGPVKCWGGYLSFNEDTDDDDFITLPKTPNLGTKPDNSSYEAIILSSSLSHICAILDDDGDTSNGGPVKCWGDNEYGQIGGGTPNLGVKSDASPHTATAITAGLYHTCVILDDGSVKCWGDNHYQQGGTPNLGTKTDGSAYTATAIAAGEDHTCIILDDGSVKCLGDNGNKQTQGGTPNLGTKPDNSDYTATAIVAGKWHTCVILDDGSVKCWGDNGNGQTGGGTPALGTKTDGSAYTATAIVAGKWHTCAILDDSSVKCWGRNSVGQTGGGTPALGTKPDGSAYTATAIVAGENQTCVILDDDRDATNGGPVRCWGAVIYNNDQNQINVNRLHAF